MDKLNPKDAAASPLQVEKSPALTKPKRDPALEAARRERAEETVRLLIAGQRAFVRPGYRGPKLEGDGEHERTALSAAALGPAFAKLSLEGRRRHRFATDLVFEGMLTEHPSLAMSWRATYKEAAQRSYVPEKGDDAFVSKTKDKHVVGKLHGSLVQGLKSKQKLLTSGATAYAPFSFHAQVSPTETTRRPTDDEASLQPIAANNNRPSPPPGPPPGLGHNRPPPEGRSSQEAFPGVRDSPRLEAILGTLDNILGGAAWGAVDQATTNQYQFLLSLNRQLNPDYHPPDSATVWERTGPRGREAQIEAVRRDLAVATHALQRDTLAFLQSRVDRHYAEGARRYHLGQLNPLLSREEAVGNFVDVAVRRDLINFYRSRRVSFGRRQFVTVNNRHYTQDGRYRVPDAAIGRVSIDWSLTEKREATPQVQGFFNSHSNPIVVIIVRPTPLGGAYSLERQANPPRE